MAGIHPIERRSPAFLIALIILGLIGVASLYLAPLEEALPPGLELPRAVLLIQPAILTALFAVLGWWAAPKVGLDAPYLAAAIDKAPAPPLGRAMIAALCVALATAAVLIGFAASTADALGSATESFDLPILTKLLYGGISEEVISRWGIMAALMLLLVKCRLPDGAAFWGANLIAAFIFGLGHFGVLFGIVADPPLWLMGAVLIGNILPALGFGWLFRRYGLESAMLAHAGGHVLATLAAPMLG